MAFNTDNTIQDRFTTHWSSSSDPGAIRWAKLKRIHYEKDLYQNIRDLLGDYTGPCGEENIDINKLRAANRASDEADRRFHARDQELHTSESSTYTTADWCRDVTRGQKLRTCRYHKLMLDTISQGVNIRILKLEKELRRKADPEKANLIIKMKMNDPDLQEMLVLVERMRILVVEEAGAGWDWKEGCKAQMVVRERQKEFDGVWGKYIEFVPDKVAIWNWSLKLKA
ncbi:hypothetical protein BDZ45DRAFT_693642 [Acephala macrosclerotiorum]|nr:hypothetical protein BDZ45DRAFT_693642 [Acephala macrosclerotiorum]